MCESKEFWDELQSSPHAMGEITFLQSITRTGMHVIDAGANRGVTTVALARTVAPDGYVYAFEPVPEYYEALRQNLSRNEVENASAFNLALSNQSGRIRFYKHGEGSGITRADAAEMLWVEATTIPGFLRHQHIGRINVLSLDCEGSELFVLQGAKAFLEEQSPQIFCEMHHGYLKELGQSADDIADFLCDLGYDVQPLQVEDLDEQTTFEKCSHIYARKQPAENKVQRLKQEIADLKAQMPVHSVKPSMIEKLEELEEELKAAQEDRER
jgi:FkbM family methyltransferase